MLGELSTFVGTLVGTLTLVLTGVFGGETHELVLELLTAGESAEISVMQAESDTEPTVVAEKTVRQPATPPPTVSSTPTPEPEAAAAATAELEDDCVSGEDLDVSASGQNVSVRVDGEKAEVCSSGEEGDSDIETNVESDSAEVHVKQKVESSGNANVKSTTTLNVSTQ